MLVLRLRGLWPLVGVAASVLIPLALGWPLWTTLLLLVPSLWLSHLVMTWLAIGALRAGTSQHAREMVPDLQSIGLSSDRGTTATSGGSRSPGGEQHSTAVADLVRVVERFGAEDLSAMVFARTHAAPMDYETTRTSILERVVSGLRASGQFDDHVAESHAAVVSVREAVGRAIDRFPDLQPSAEFEAEMLDHASDLARYIVLRPRLSVSEYEALWAPYEALLPELAAAAGGKAVASPGAVGSSTAARGQHGFESSEAQGKAPTIDEIEDRVLHVLQYDMLVDEPHRTGSLRHEYGLADFEVDGLVRDSMARWAIQPLMRRAAPIAPEDIQRVDTVADVAAVIAASYGHDASPKSVGTTTTDRFGPQTSAVFEVLREARSLPLHAGRAFEHRFSSMADPEIRSMRKAMAEAMWAARRKGRAKHVKEARRLVDRAAGRSVLRVHTDNHSWEATDQAGAAGQFAIMAVMAEATRDHISPETYLCLTKTWRAVVSD